VHTPVSAGALSCRPTDHLCCEAVMHADESRNRYCREFTADGCFKICIGDFEEEDTSSIKKATRLRVALSSNYAIPFTSSWLPWLPWA
jgi:hypothetical protein